MHGRWRWRDVGPAGVDKGKGGKYLILPPGYKDRAPDGYIALPAQTYTGFFILRSNLISSSDADVAKAVAYGKRVRFYPLSQAGRSSSMPVMDAASAPSAAGGISSTIGPTSLVLKKGKT